MIWKQLTNSTMVPVHLVCRETIHTIYDVYIYSFGELQALKVLVAEDSNSWAYTELVINE